MPKILAGGVRTHYQQLGSGPDVVLLHGLGANLAFWYLGAAPLLADGYRVTAYDLRGHGLSGRTPGGYTTAELAADLRAVLDQLHIGRAVVIGHSYGAAVALHAAVLYPDRVRAVVAADAYLPCVERGSSPWRDVRARVAIRRLRQRGLDVPRNLPRVAYGLLDEVARRPATTDGGGPMAWSSTSLTVASWRRLTTETSLVRDLRAPTLPLSLVARVPVPVEAVYGQRSPCRASLRGLRSVLPQLELALIQDAGHLHPLLEPARFARVVRPFLAARWGSGSSRDSAHRDVVGPPVTRA